MTLVYSISINKYKRDFNSNISTKEEPDGNFQISGENSLEMYILSI